MDSLTINSGPLAAVAPDARGVRAYKGLPYAAPPVGPLRWRAPQPVAPWREPRATGAFGPDAMQGAIWDDIRSLPAPAFPRIASISMSGPRPRPARTSGAPCCSGSMAAVSRRARDRSRAMTGRGWRRAESSW